MILVNLKKIINMNDKSNKREISINTCDGQIIVINRAFGGPISR
jgi:hypothetical protein